jgi:ABC-type nitrate/sulfonate/bicarbonate transport system substrate-binding protein
MQLRANVFPGIQNLPHYAGIEHGFFSARGLDVALTYTTSSEAQREALAKGACDIAHAALDNAVAMVDVAREDIVIVVGLDPSFNRIVVQSEIATYEDLRGKTLGVDAPDTAFALIAYDVLARKGLPQGSYRGQPVGATRFRLEALQDGRIDFSLLNLPFNLMARDSGLKLLDDPLAIIGRYQSVGGFVRREWARDNAQALTSYLAAYIEGVRWVLDPANRDAGAQLLAREMSLSATMASECIDALTRPQGGLAIDAKLDVEGMRKVLELRARFTGGADAEPAPLSRYYDDTYYAAALALLATPAR